MLLYVDKKRQKRQKIKAIIITFLGIFVLLANLIIYQKLLHTPRLHLVDYRPILGENHNLLQRDTVCVFLADEALNAEIIVIPEVLSRENLLTIGMVVAKFMLKARNVYFMPDVTDVDYLFRLIRLFVPHIHHSANESGVIITTKLDSVVNMIKERQLSPRVFNYNYAQKQIDENILVDLIDERFPLPEVPVDALAKEKKALTDFVDMYKVVFSSLLSGKWRMPFAVKHFMLQQANACVMMNGKALCQINENASLLENLYRLRLGLSANENLSQLILLTSLQEIRLNEPLAEDDGVVLRYGEREEIVLPKERNGIDNVYVILRRKMGINSDYFDEDMKFFRFKVVEVNFDEKI